MKHKSLILLMFFLSTFSYSLNWQDYQLKLIQETEKQTSTGLTVSALLQDPDNKNPFELFYQKEPNSDLIYKIRSTVTSFYQWPQLKIKKIRIILQGENDFQVVIFPSRLNYKNVDLTAYLPGGMLFFYEEKRTFYEFRLLDKNLFIKIRGTLLKREQLMEHILLAVGRLEKNPDSIVTKTNGHEKVFELKNGKIPVDNKKTSENKKNTHQISNTNSQMNKNKHSKIKIAEQKSTGRPNFIPNIIKIYAGSGALISAGYFLEWKDWSFGLTLGGVYDKLDEVNASKTAVKTKTIIGVPIGLRIEFAPFHSTIIEPYALLHGVYTIGAMNYNSRFLPYLGIGELFFKRFFAEISLSYHKKKLYYILGIGYRLKL